MSIRIFATGGHSGLGFEALKTLLASPKLASGGHITLFVRDEKAAPARAAVNKLSQQWNALHKASSSSTSKAAELALETRTMDLASLPTVRQAASSLKSALKLGSGSASGLDVFLLNAAVAKTKRETVIDEDRASSSDHKYHADHLVSEDRRIETTACVNHVAHLLFITSLVPTIAENAKNGRKTRIVFTGSALHRSVKDLGVLDDFFAASSHNGSSSKPWTLRETYAASKFLQMLGIRALRRRIEDILKEQGVPAGLVEVVVVQPGFVPQTGLSRESSLLTRFAMSYLLPWAPFATSLDDAGKYIADACTIDLPAETSSEPGSEEQDGFHSQNGLVRSALLKVHAKKQRFGTLDLRTGDISLQDKWWPAACDHV